MPLSSQPIQARSVISSTDPPGDTGVLWRDENTTPPTLRQHDGEEWIPIASRPISHTDSAETFSESEVTIGHSGTELVDSGRIYPTSTVEQTRLTIGTGVNRSRVRNDTLGVDFTPQQDILGVSVRPQASDTGSIETVELRNGGTTLDSTSGAHNTWSELVYPLEAGETYKVTASGNLAEIDGESFPIGGEYITLEAWSNGDIYDNGINGVAALTHDNTAGDSVTIEWPNPEDMYSWDSATFNRSNDNVSVYLEENRSGSWTEIAGPISRGSDIPAVAGRNVRFRADYSDIGFLDAVYRRYQV